MTISPLDYRYGRNEAKHIWSREGRHSRQLEVERALVWAHCQLGRVSAEDYDVIADIADPGIVTADRVDEIEKETKHDIMALTKAMAEAAGEAGWCIHLGATSNDIVDSAVALQIKDSIKLQREVLHQLISTLCDIAIRERDTVMLGRTHGQAASPVTLGKEIMVFVERLQIQKDALANSVYAAKFGGATGGFNAHKVAYPNVDWVSFGNSFVEANLGLHRSKVTTQIEHYDYLAAWCDALRRAHTVMIDLDRDVWTYISLDYFKQKIVKGEVGSSAMPHKVNPIDFENSEGNFGVANAMLQHFAEKLPISRMQRDLTDSTVLRNVGVPLGHAIIALKSLQKGLGKLLLNESALKAALEANWAVVSEGVQTILRREGYPKPYEVLKALTRTGEAITAETMSNFINTLDVSDSVKAELKAITPSSYTGYSESLALD